MGEISEPNTAVLHQLGRFFAVILVEHCPARDMLPVNEMLNINGCDNSYSSQVDLVFRNIGTTTVRVYLQEYGNDQVRLRFKQ